MRFDGKIAAITGAGSGIGRALAVKLASEGCSVAISDVDEKGLAETAEMVARYNVGYDQLKLDVSDRDAVENWAEAVVEKMGSADYVFNNAGVTLLENVANTEYDDFRWVMDINFWGMVYGSKAFLKYFQSRGSGHIINVSSLFGLVAFPNQAAYNASKFAIRGFTEALGLELKDTDIFVSSVHPGGIRTSIARNARANEANLGGRTVEDFANNFEASARTTPEEAAEVILSGVLKRKRRILIGKDARFMDRVQRLFPEKYGPMLQKILPKSKK